MSVRNAIVMFCDCHNFSRVQLEIGDEIVSFMDAFYRRCGACLVDRGGQIIKYLGDAILAIFPDDHASVAVESARCMQSEYAALIAELEVKTESDLEVGLSFGALKTGTVGHESLRTFDVYGECVNEAAIIGHHRGIAVTEALRAHLPKDVSVREIESYKPKWRNDPLRVWEVVEDPKPA